ncbi:MAG TPA: TadE/TadG family type IV pilus assembly protein [Terracidiphilus sp.]|jgi:Flp pilus assembly protein TadG
MDINDTNRSHLAVGSRDSEGGQALVELALTMPLLIALLFGATELGSVTFEAIELTNSARAAVQYGAQTPITAADTAGILAAAKQDAYDLATSNGTTNFTATVSSTCMCSNGSAAASCAIASCPTSQLEQVLTVQTSATFTPVIHVPDLPTSFTLHGSAVQRVLNN